MIQHPISNQASSGTAPRHSTQFSVSVGIQFPEILTWTLDIPCWISDIEIGLFVLVIQIR